MKTRVETFSSGRKLSTTLAGAFFLFSAVVLLLYTGLMGLYDYRTLEALISSRQQLIARDAAKAVSGFIHDNFSVLETAIWLTDFDTQREVERRRILQSLLGLRPAIRRLVLLDPHDQVLARASRLSMQASGQFTDRRLEELLSGQDRKAKRRMSTVTIDPVTGEPLVWLAVPVTDAFEDVRGTLIAELNLKSMWDIVDQLRVGETGYVYVADREGNLLAFQDTSRVLKGGRVSHIRVVADFIRNKPAVQPVAVERFQGIKGSTVVGTYAPLTMPDWAVVTELPWEEAYRVMARNLAAAVAFTLGIAILAGIFGVRVARRMAKPVIQLTETASRIAAGEPDLKAEVGGPREVACLAVAFNSMTSQLRQSLVDLEDRFGELKRTEEALRLSEQRLRLALEATSDGIWDWNLETGRVYFSPRYYTMMGYEPDEFPASYENWKRWVHPVDLEAAEKLVWQAIQDRTSYTIEFRFRAKDGDWRWILARGKVVETDEAGKAVRVSGTHSDITPRKRVEEALEKRILALTQPLGSVENIALEDILNLSDLQHLSDLFAKAFGVASLITRPDGTPITQPSNFTSFCSEIVRKTPRGLEKCNHSDAIIGRHNPSGPNIQPCLSAGLCNAGASITLGGSHVANWLIGQVRNEGVDEEKIMEYGREIGADEGVFRAAYLEVPVMSQEQFDNTAHVLFAVANQISNSAYQNILQARFISERKQAEESLRKYERIVSSSQDVMALINTDYVYETVNESLLKLQGRSREEIVGRTVSKVMGEKTFRHKLKARLDQALSGQTVHFQESFDYGETGRRVMDVNY
ncbi:MAG TPA: PocR ligand-binding domain-containing protein [Syntrophobacteraceae bacterium]|nr:PocR ligand-binding domain-containing protein [Syntrophobacteraceae bacterium]